MAFFVRSLALALISLSACQSADLKFQLHRCEAKLPPLEGRA